MTGRLLERLGVELPIVQAGLGGGIARHELAAAVSAAGGLGTIGFADPDTLRRELAAGREDTGRPLAVNLLLPFARDAHWEAIADADVVVTFWGRPRRRRSAPAIWIHQVGSVDEARAARDAGADAVIAQGAEAGGHVRGSVPAVDLLEQVRAALPGFSVLSAGGVVDAADVVQRLDAGAEAAVLGTRFLMSDESRAHALYKRRLTEERETVVTELFGAGWPRAPHRVIWNEATERWLGRGRDGTPSRARRPGPAAVRALQLVTAPLLSRLPPAGQRALAGRASARMPLLSPLSPVDDGPAALVEAGALYAGECVARIDDVRPAGELVRELAPG